MGGCFGGFGVFWGFFSEESRIVKPGFLLSMNTKSTNFFSKAQIDYLL